MIKLIAIDLDGTLLRSDHTISEENFQAIQKAKDHGIKIVLASGRPPCSIIRYAEELKLNSNDDYFISFNGAMVSEAKSKKIVEYFSIKGSDYKQLYKLGVEYGFEPYTFDADYCIATKDYYWVQMEHEVNDIGIKILENIDDMPNDEVLSKVMYSSDEDFMDENIAKIPDNIYDKYTVVRSSPNFLEFLNKRANKGSAVKVLADKLGINRNDIMCMGDRGNDIHMLKYAGIGVAMGNASEETKEAADFVTLSNEENGVAFAINKFICG